MSSMRRCRTTMALESASRSCCESTLMRGSITAARSVRTRASTWEPFSVMLIRTARASSGSGARTTKPASSRRCTCVVIVGWEQWSSSARSEILAVPRSSIVPSSRAWAHGSGSRMRWVASRFSRATAVSNSDPRPVPDGLTLLADTRKSLHRSSMRCPDRARCRFSSVQAGRIGK